MITSNYHCPQTSYTPLIAHPVGGLRDGDGGPLLLEPCFNGTSQTPRSPPQEVLPVPVLMTVCKGLVLTIYAHV